mgnify:CR=1 FL=1
MLSMSTPEHSTTRTICRTSQGTHKLVVRKTDQDHQPDKRRPTCALTDFFFEGLEAIGNLTDLRQLWSARRVELSASSQPVGLSLDWSAFSSVCTSVQAQPEDLWTRVWRRASRCGGSEDPPLGSSCPPDAGATAESKLIVLRMHILAQELSLDSVLRTAFLPAASELISRMAQLCDLTEIAAYWNSRRDPRVGWQPSRLDLLSYLSSSGDDGQASRVSFRDWCSSLGLSLTVAESVSSFCWRSSLVERIRQLQHGQQSSTAGIELLNDLARRGVPAPSLSQLTWPVSIAIAVITRSAHENPQGLTEDALRLVDRLDAAAQSAEEQSPVAFQLHYTEDDIRSLPHHHQLRLPWLCGQLHPHDLRLQEVARLFDTTRPQFVRIGKRDGTCVCNLPSSCSLPAHADLVYLFRFSGKSLRPQSSKRCAALSIASRRPVWGARCSCSRPRDSTPPRRGKHYRFILPSKPLPGRSWRRVPQ